MRFNFVLYSICRLFLTHFLRGRLLSCQSLTCTHPAHRQTCKCANLLPQLLVVTRKFSAALGGRWRSHNLISLIPIYCTLVVVSGMNLRWKGLRVAST
jgi:hypothetical protein